MSSDEVEPNTLGSVTLMTGLGPLKFLLFSQEAPLACRSFVQLCMEGYYDQSSFHRLLPDFCLQGGDPSATGFGGESIYEGPTPHPAGPFVKELHPRLRFNRRGLVGVVAPSSYYSSETSGAKGHGSRNASASKSLKQLTDFKKTTMETFHHLLKGSQFFITLGDASELNKSTTLFAKLDHSSLFTLNALSKLERHAGTDAIIPTPSAVIKYAIVHDHPFDDINPRHKVPIAQIKSDRNSEFSIDEKPKLFSTSNSKLSVKKSRLLSFDLEDESKDDYLERSSINGGSTLDLERIKSMDQNPSKKEAFTVDKINSKSHSNTLNRDNSEYPLKDKLFAATVIDGLKSIHSTKKNADGTRQSSISSLNLSNTKESQNNLKLNEIKMRISAVRAEIGKSSLVNGSSQAENFNATQAKKSDPNATISRLLNPNAKTNVAASVIIKGGTDQPFKHSSTNIAFPNTTDSILNTNSEDGVGICIDITSNNSLSKATCTNNCNKSHLTVDPAGSCDGCNGGSAVLQKRKSHPAYENYVNIDQVHHRRKLSSGGRRGGSDGKASEMETLLALNSFREKLHLVMDLEGHGASGGSAATSLISAPQPEPSPYLDLCKLHGLSACQSCRDTFSYNSNGGNVADGDGVEEEKGWLMHHLVFDPNAGYRKSSVIYPKPSSTGKTYYTGKNGSIIHKAIDDGNEDVYDDGLVVIDPLAFASRRSK